MTAVTARDRTDATTEPPPFTAPYAADDAHLIAALLEESRVGAEADDRIDTMASALIEGIRSRSHGLGGVEDFLREYGLSTREGLALMVLAEALLRVPDAETADRLIEDKLGAADWSAHGGHGDTWLVSASTWALGLSSRIVLPGETPEGILSGLVKRLGLPAVRGATRRAMRVLAHQFVLGETIEGALSRARSAENRGYRYSYDMLGEGARTAADATTYFESYANAIDAIGRAAGCPGPVVGGVRDLWQSTEGTTGGIKRGGHQRSPRLKARSCKRMRHLTALTLA